MADDLRVSHTPSRSHPRAWGGRELPSRYAWTKPSEDFAESYRAFIDGKLQGCCVERARFMWEEETVLWPSSRGKTAAGLTVGVLPAIGSQLCLSGCRCHIKQATAAA